MRRLLCSALWHCVVLEMDSNCRRIMTITSSDFDSKVGVKRFLPNIDSPQWNYTMPQPRRQTEHLRSWKPENLHNIIGCKGSKPYRVLSSGDGGKGLSQKLVDLYRTIRCYRSEHLKLTHARPYIYPGHLYSSSSTIWSEFVHLVFYFKALCQRHYLC